MPCLPWCVCSLRQFWTASLPSCRDTMKGLSSLQSSPSQWVAMFLFLDTQSCFFHRSQRKPVICWKLNLRSWTSVSFFFSPPAATPAPRKVKAAAKYVEVPVSLSICLLLYYSPCLSQSVSIFVFHPHSDSRGGGWNMKQPGNAKRTLCIEPQSCACWVFVISLSVCHYAVLNMCER